MDYKISFSDAASVDILNIFNHLFRSYIDFGDDDQTALQRAYKRITSIWDKPNILRSFPRRGRIFDRDNGIRFITIDNTIYWFHVRDAITTVEIIAVFLGQQDHINQMAERLKQ